MVMSANQDRAEVLLFPPFVGLVLFLTGVGLQIASPIDLFSGTWLSLATGLPVLAFGIGLQVACIKAMKRAKTTPLFKKPTERILQSGPYGRSRNPIYVAVIIQFLGLALLINTLWLILLIPVLFLYLQFGVIVREEQYLHRKFGDEYLDYKSDVPRWI